MMMVRCVALILLGGLFAVASTRTCADQLTPVDVRMVKVNGEIGRRIKVTVENNLLELNVDEDFLKPFQDRNAQDGYIGVGKLIDALVRFAAYTNDGRVLERKKYVIDALIASQGPDGYIGAFVPEKRLWRLWDLHEMAYIIYGLATDYELFEEEASLEAAKKLARYVMKGLSAEPNHPFHPRTISLELATLGLEAALVKLRALTGDPQYQYFCIDYRDLHDWDLDIVTGRWGPIEGHAYAYLCRCVAQLRLFRAHPDPRLVRQPRRVVDFLTRRNGLAVTGTCGYHECWHDTQIGTRHLGETCATAYLIRFFDELLRIEGDPRYGDLIERSVYNALFAAQSPDGRRIRYYTPFEGKRTYFDGDTYCCPNNYRRIVAELPAMIYYGAGSGFAVNLYTPSMAHISLTGGVTVDVRQETTYPNSGNVVIRLTPSERHKFPVRLRIPRWCPTARILVNDEVREEGVPGGSFYTIDQHWLAGDDIRLEMPMPWRLVKGRQAQAGRVAVMRGPLVFCLNRERHEGLEDLDPGLIAIDRMSLEPPVADDSVRPGGLACRLRAWGPDQWYPSAEPALALTLTEFADPGGEAVYFHVPDPNAATLVDDELLDLMPVAAAPEQPEE